jgi:rSAM/selenodomain-associated transferase 2
MRSVPGRISVIIPMLNESATVAKALESVRHASDVEVIVVDGGSSDGAVSVAAGLGARVLSSPPGRARQMNAGARAAMGEWLLFLHADTQLPKGFDADLRQVMAADDTVAGAFSFRIDGQGFGLRLVEAVTNLRSRRGQLPYGDQAIFLKTGLFREMGGYPKIPIMEDFELVRRLRRRGKIAIASSAVLTSARRWKRIGVWKTTLINWVVVVAYLLGVSPGRIARWYRRERGLL